MPEAAATSIRHSASCIERLLIVRGFQIVDIRLIVQRFVCRVRREFCPDVVGIAAVAWLPVFLQRVFARGADRERDRGRNIAPALLRKRLSVHAVRFLKHKQIYRDLLSAESVFLQNDMALHVNLAILGNVRMVV